MRVELLPSGSPRTHDSLPLNRSVSSVGERTGALKTSPKPQVGERIDQSDLFIEKGNRTCTCMSRFRVPLCLDCIFPDRSGKCNRAIRVPWTISVYLREKEERNAPAAKVVTVRNIKSRSSGQYLHRHLKSLIKKDPK